MNQTTSFLEYPAPMDREMLKRHLAEAEEHIATGDKNIARQRDLIAQTHKIHNAVPPRECSGGAGK
jgi:hypothetical protein